MANKTACACSVFLMVLICGWSPSAFAQTTKQPAQDAEATLFSEIELPAVVTDAVVGGDGRYLLLHFESTKNLGLFDVTKRELVGEFPIGENSAYAIGAAKMLIADGASQELKRYDLESLELELTKTIDLPEGAAFAVMGSASNGPAILRGIDSNYVDTGLKLVDMDSLEITDMPLTRTGGGHSITAKECSARISANGSTFTITGDGRSGMLSITKRGDAWTGFRGNLSHAVPTADGKFLHVGFSKFTAELSRVTQVQGIGSVIPAVHGPLYLTVKPSRYGAKDQKTVVGKLFLEGNDQELSQVEGIELPSGPNARNTKTDSLPLNKRVVLIPDLNSIVQLSHSCDKLLIRQFDFENLIAESQVDFFFEDSTPVATVKAGEKYQHTFEVTTRSPAIDYSLELGPAEMTVSDEGVLSWQTTSSSPELNEIIVSFSDEKDRIIYSSFQLKVEGGITDADGSALENDSSTKELAFEQIDLTPSVMETESKTIVFPSLVDQAISGGRGRLIIAYLPKQHCVAVVDLEEAKIVKFLNAPRSNPVFAVGANHLLMYDDQRRTLSRYNLTTFECEVTKPIPFEDTISSMGMGSGSYGPVMVKVDNSHRGTLEFVDLETLEKIDVTWSKKKPSLSHPVNFNPTLICASAAGRVFSVSNEGVMRLEGSNVTQYSSIRVSNGPSIPSSDGSRVVYNGKILKCPLIQVSEQSVNYGMTVPAISAPYFISYKWPGPSDRAPVTQTAKLYWFEDLQLLATFESTGPFTDGRMQGKTISSALRRVFLVPQSNILATFAKTSDKLVLHRLDVEQLLAESGKDYFYVDSMAPPLARLKSKFEYQVKAKAKHGGLKYSLEAAPTGMQVSSLGKITWEVPQGYGEERVNVIVEIENSKGRSVFHPFEIGFPELARLTERKRIAKKKQYRKQVKLAEEKRRRTRIAFNTEKSQEERRRRDNARRFSMRDWADKTGKHQIRAQFVRVVDRTTVVLMSPKGKEIKIPLEKLSDRDIFLAVRNDLQPKTQIEEKTPFEKDGGEQ